MWSRKELHLPNKYYELDSPALNRKSARPFKAPLYSKTSHLSLTKSWDVTGKWGCCSRGYQFLDQLPFQTWSHKPLWVEPYQQSYLHLLKSTVIRTQLVVGKEWVRK